MQRTDLRAGLQTVFPLQRLLRPDRVARLLEYCAEARRVPRRGARPIRRNGAPERERGKGDQHDHQARQGEPARAFGITQGARSIADAAEERVGGIRRQRHTKIASLKRRFIRDAG